MLPFLDDMKRESDVLASSQMKLDHRDAAETVIRALCEGLKSFERLSIPTILGGELPIPDANEARFDREWIERFGYNLDRVLRKNELPWPPPTAKSCPPSIVEDLRVMYDSIAFRQRLLSPVTSATLLDVVAPVQRKACKLASDWEDKGHAVAETLRDDANRRKVTKLYNTITILSFILGIAQIPGTVKDLRDELPKYQTNISRVINGAAHAAISEARATELVLVEAGRKPPKMDFGMHFS